MPVPPRLLVSLAGNARLEMVEEYVTGADHGSHITMPVAEVGLGPGASLKHGYIHREGAGAQHFKATLVSQVGHVLLCCHKIGCSDVVPGQQLQYCSVPLSRESLHLHGTC